MAKKKLSLPEKRELMNKTIGYLTEKLNSPHMKKTPGKPEVVVGFDLSSQSTGFVVLQDGKRVEDGTFGTDSKYGTYIERDAFMYAQFKRILETWQPTIICMEQVSVFQDLHAAKMLIEVQATLHLAIAHTVGTNTLFFDVTTTQVKKVATGTSKASKPEVIAGIRERFGEDIKDDNVADAYSAAVVGLNLRAFVERYDKLKAKHYEGKDEKQQKTFLMKFTQGKHFSEEADIAPKELHEVIIGMLLSPGMRILKNNDVKAYYRIWRELVPLED